MKVDTMGMDTPISKKDLTALTKETKETIAADLNTNGNRRSFGVVDLWNVRKKQRISASTSRWLLN